MFFFLGLTNGRTVYFRLNFYWSQVRIPSEIAIFSYNFLSGGYFCSSKCPGLIVANFELMINSLLMNRVKSCQCTAVTSLFSMKKYD